MPRTFSLEEARALLPEVSEIAEAMRDRKRAFDQARRLIRDAGEQAGSNGHVSRDALGAQADAERLVQ